MSTCRQKGEKVFCTLVCFLLVCEQYFFAHFIMGHGVHPARSLHPASRDIISSNQKFSENQPYETGLNVNTMAHVMEDYLVLLLRKVTSNGDGYRPDPG